MAVLFAKNFPSRLPRTSPDLDFQIEIFFRATEIYRDFSQRLLACLVVSLGWSAAWQMVPRFWQSARLSDFISIDNGRSYAYKLLTLGGLTLDLLILWKQKPTSPATRPTPEPEPHLSAKLENR